MSGRAKDVADLLRLATRHGWTTRTLRNGHIEIRTPSGEWVCNVSPKPGSSKAVDTLRSALRRAGLPVDRR